jgi:citrate/tricarballylate utilization protein
MSIANTIPIALVGEAQRMLSICNACRYCEGFCAVFPALERRLSFDEGDIAYLSNLCHNCGACYYSCQYAPPHEFQLNFPKMLANVRVETYQKYAWPSAFAALFRRNGITVGVATVLALTVVLVVMSMFAATSFLLSPHSLAQGAFYAIVPHGVMAASFGVVFAFAMFALAVGVIRFWRDTGEKASALVSPGPFVQSMDDALRLKYLDGGGDGCMYPDEAPSQARRWMHHLTFYGFMLCFAATCVATFYHYVFAWSAPYPLLSLPVLLGTVGGVMLVIGCAGLLVIKYRSDVALSGDRQAGIDVGFLALLLTAAISGLALLALRETAAMGLALALHLAAVMALFLTIPYGKFVHGVYRFAALMRFHVERRRPVMDIASE